MQRQSLWSKLCLVSCSLLFLPMLAVGQGAALNTNSVLYRSAYRNALHFLASAHAHAVAVGEGDQADAYTCATIGIKQADLAALLNEDATLSNSMVALQSTALKERELPAGTQRATSNNYADLQTTAINASRTRLALRMSPAGFKAFNAYIIRVVIPATHVMTTSNPTSTGGTSK